MIGIAKTSGLPKHRDCQNIGMPEIGKARLQTGTTVVPGFGVNAKE
jgi:hypothetical protein